MHKTISTSIGELTLFVDDDGAITRLDFGGGRAPGNGRAATARGLAEDALDLAATQLREYLAGERSAFDLPLRATGNAFEQLVWAELVRIPYGETASYGEIARRIGHPGAARAVGRANARNPIAIVVPCHRVIGSDGSLTGYAGGLDLKRALLALEAGPVAQQELSLG
jgi:methylated-DNA-[protein]-cysteine S-methyltransferase